VEKPTALQALLEHSGRLLEMVEGADLATLADRVRPTLIERDRLLAALVSDHAMPPGVTPLAVAQIEALDRKIAAHLARRRDEAWLAATGLSQHRRPAPRIPAAPPPRFLDRTG